ncbi:hypothetical protein MRB53_003012 [Persea americana]|uniref:Uncharacterized protein n=1 Tax=Persea americana TaxID=3435 RepID=A0ACC2MWD6_PERAE|nr:hypothetical protein MRB53_003012 [Persea americana]
MVCKAFKVYRHLKPRSTVNETIAMAMETMKTCGDDNSATVTMQEEEEEETKEWEVEVDSGVFITFISQPHGGNLLKKLRFSKDQFNGTEAKIWWIDNYDRITELYSVERTNPPWESTSVSTEDALIAPSCSPEADPIHAPDSCDSLHTARPMLSTEISSMESIAMSSDSNFEEEWDEEDEREPGVSLTIRSYRDGTRKIKHVYFSPGSVVQ